MTRAPVRSNEQLKQTIRNHLRHAFGEGLDDDAQTEYAARMMGREYLPLIGQVHARLKPTEPN